MIQVSPEKASHILRVQDESGEGPKELPFLGRPQAAGSQEDVDKEWLGMDAREALAACAASLNISWRDCLVTSKWESQEVFDSAVS